MAKPSKQPAGPTQAERAILFRLMYDSSLFQAHPIVVSNVRATVEELLVLLGRPDLADLWSDAEKLAKS